MTRNNDVSTEDDADFVLKHRITGAAFLIVFGVLFLPWLLSAPSQSNQANAESTDSISLDASRAEIEEELLAAIESEAVVEQDLEIYVSRITPLDAQGSSQNNTTTTENADVAPEEVVKPEIPESNKQDVVEEKIPQVADTPKETVVQKVEKQDPEPEPAKVEKPTTNIEVGWVVQVGVFTDTKGAAQVVADLKDKGFSPSTTIVDTNLGKATGTRVWLGPYAQRVEAAKSKTTLKDETGGDGFIRAYP